MDWTRLLPSLTPECADHSNVCSIKKQFAFVMHCRDVVGPATLHKTQPACLIFVLSSASADLKRIRNQSLTNLAFQRKYCLFLNLKFHCQSFNITSCGLELHDSLAALADSNLKPPLPPPPLLWENDQVHCYTSEETGTGLRTGAQCSHKQDD